MQTVATTTDPARLLHEHFGFADFRPGQREVLEALVNHGSALAVFPTGAGKSLCYQLPALSYDGVTLVVSPLIALMKDQIDFLATRGIPAAKLDSTLNAAEAAGINARLRNNDLKLLYVAPERFNNERFLEELKHLKIALFAVDEAHCISEWGHNFRPDYLKLAGIARDLGVQRVLALTATATPKVVEEICDGFNIRRDCAVVTGFYRPNLNLATTPVTPATRDALLLTRLKKRKPGPTIVYVTLQKTAERLATLLTGYGLPARAYHAGMETEERTAVQDWWIASDNHIVTATIAFGMGIDKANVRYVYHYNLPKSLESYSQEIGRAGRDGVTSTVELLCCPEDVPVLENFAYGDTPTEASLRQLLTELMASGPEFSVNLHDLSARHDIRQLVLKTALTYLELLGVLRQGTPYYEGYQMRLLTPLPAILEQFKDEPKQLVADIFKRSSKGSVWYSLNPQQIADKLSKDRQRVVRAVQYLEQHGWVELRSSDVRQRYTRLRETEDIDALTAELAGRFSRREEQETVRLEQVLDLVTHDGCQASALAAYFGEIRAADCGHCTFCVTREPRELPEFVEPPPLPEGLDMAGFQGLRSMHPAALGQPRQAARFLCGLCSPAVAKAKLGRHQLFGRLEHRRFAEVLQWVSGL